MYYDFTPILMLIFEISAIAGSRRPSQHFQVLMKYAEVEKKVISYAESQKTLLGQALGWGSNRRTHICNTSSLRVRIEFCKRALHTDFYGFEFDLDNYAYSPCKLQDFWTKSSAHYQLDMFTCPSVVYEDVEINRKVLLPYVYSASRGKSHDTAFLFVQEQFSVFKYPLQYIKNIHFDTLKDKSESDTFTIWESLILPGYMKNPIRMSGEKQRGQFIVYRKFMRRFKSINVCGLRRRQKIFICRLHIERKFLSQYAQIQTEGYVGECRKHRIDVNSVEDVSNAEQLVLLCPPIKRSFAEEKLAAIGNHYVSTKASPYTTILLHRENRKGQKLRFVNAYHYTVSNIATLMRDISLERFRPYPSEGQRKKRAAQESAAQIINENNRLHPISSKWQGQTAPIPSVNAFRITKWSFEPNDSNMSSAVWLAEDLIISFSKIKTTIRIYRRFMDTYKSTGLCERSESEHQSICEQAGVTIRIETQVRATKFSIDRDEVSSCRRRQVLLRVREAEDLASDIFVMRQCRYSKDSFVYSYFVGKVHMWNTAIIYRSFSEDNETKLTSDAVYPHQVIININSKLFPTTRPIFQPVIKA